LRGRGTPLHIQKSQQHAADADRHQKEETPAPAQVIDHQAADAWADDKPDMMRGCHIALCSSSEILRNRFRGLRPAGGLQQRTAYALQKTKHYELNKRLGEAAQKRAGAKYQKA
jgi:hypothetical protein